MSEQRYLPDEVSSAFNRAAADIIQAVGPDDIQRRRDDLNALINVGMIYLEDPATSLNLALVQAYSRPAEEVLDWLQGPRGGG